MADSAISTTGLTKHFGDVKALVNLDLTVEKDEVFGFLGPNGAGKTTTIRSLLGYLHPTAGSATVLGLDSQTDSVAIRAHIGYLPAEYEMYDKLTGGEMLRYYANLRGGADDTYILELAERFKADLDKKVRDYSTGNKQKLGIIQAFMSQPDLLILDEPSTGLDPLMQQELQGLIRETVAQGRTVFLSSHTLSEVQRVADRVGILKAGELVTVQRVDDLMKSAVHRLDMEFAQPVAADVFDQLPQVREVQGHDAYLSVRYDGPVRGLLQVALDHGIVNLTSEEGDLEEVFLTYYRDPS